MNFDKIISLIKGELGKTIGQDNLQKMGMFQKELARAAEKMEKVVDAFEDNYEEPDPNMVKFEDLVREFSRELLGKLEEQYEDDESIAEWDNTEKVDEWKMCLYEQFNSSEKDYLSMAICAMFLWCHKKKIQDEIDRRMSIQEEMMRDIIEDL